MVDGGAATEDGCRPCGLARRHGWGTHVASFTETTTHGSHTIKSALSDRVVKSWWRDALFLNFLPRHTLPHVTFKQGCCFPHPAWYILFTNVVKCSSLEVYPVKKKILKSWFLTLSEKCLGNMVARSPLSPLRIIYTAEDTLPRFSCESRGQEVFEFIIIIIIWSSSSSPSSIMNSDSWQTVSAVILDLRWKVSPAGTL